MTTFKIVTRDDEKHLDPNGAQIAYPDSFRELDSDRKIEYIKKLSSALTHKLEMMQQEKDEAMSKISRQESLIENLQITIEKKRELYIQQMNHANDRLQELQKVLAKKGQRTRMQDGVVKSNGCKSRARISRAA